MRAANRRRGFTPTNVAGRRPPADGDMRTAVLNVRATPDQYLRWRRAADRAGCSLSSWVARWLDELAGVPARVLPLLEKLAPRHRGRVPLRELEFELWYRWGWDRSDVHNALLRLSAQELVVLVTEQLPRAIEPLVPMHALRNVDDFVVTHVALPIGARPRPNFRYV